MNERRSKNGGKKRLRREEERISKRKAWARR